MTMVYEKLAAWARLHRECEQMREELRAIRTRGDEDAGAASPRQTHYLALRAKADAALHEASELLRTRHAKPGAQANGAGR